MENDILLTICPVCGFEKLREPPYDKWGYPSYEICPCCGFEYGFDDSSKKMTFDGYREKWIKEGFTFFRKSDKPKVWTQEVLHRQLKNISKVNYKPRILLSQ